jgi:hypothetical protein
MRTYLTEQEQAENYPMIPYINKTSSRPIHNRVMRKEDGLVELVTDVNVSPCSPREREAYFQSVLEGANAV